MMRHLSRDIRKIGNTKQFFEDVISQERYEFDSIAEYHEHEAELSVPVYKQITRRGRAPRITIPRVSFHRVYTEMDNAFAFMVFDDAGSSIEMAWEKASFNRHRVEQGISNSSTVDELVFSWYKANRMYWIEEVTKNTDGRPRQDYPKDGGRAEVLQMPKLEPAVAFI